jgi:hypothetical protein
MSQCNLFHKVHVLTNLGGDRFETIYSSDTNRRKHKHTYRIIPNLLIKVMLKAKIVPILFSQIHQNYAMYTFEIFTVDGITIAYQIESIT